MKGDQPHQPPDTLYALALGGHYFGTQQMPLNPPLVQSLKHFYNLGGNVGKKPWHNNVKEGVILKAPLSICHHLTGRSNNGVLGV